MIFAFYLLVALTDPLETPTHNPQHPAREEKPPGDHSETPPQGSPQQPAPGGKPPGDHSETPPQGAPQQPASEGKPPGDHSEAPPQGSPQEPAPEGKPPGDHSETPPPGPLEQQSDNQGNQRTLRLHLHKLIPRGQRTLNYALAAFLI